MVADRLQALVCVEGDRKALACILFTPARTRLSPKSLCTAWPHQLQCRRGVPMRPLLNCRPFGVTDDISQDAELDQLKAVREQLIEPVSRKSTQTKDPRGNKVDNRARPVA